MIAAVVAALFCFQDEAQLRAWVDQLSSIYEDERTKAREELVKAGDKAEAPLVDALGRDDHQVRRCALELLTALRSPRAVAKARAFFASAEEDRSVRQAAFDYFCAVPKAAEEGLLDALDSTEENWQLGALQALSEISSLRGVARLAELYERRDTPTPVKNAAFLALQRAGAEARPHLLKMLPNADPLVRLGALRGLATGGSDIDAIAGPVTALFKIESDPGVLSEAYDLLRRLKEKAEPVFREGLGSTQVAVRMKSIEGLTELGGDGALPVIGELFLNDPADSVRTLARDFLVQRGGRSEDVFVKGLDHKDPKVRLLAMGSLGDIKSEKAFDRIAELFAKDPDREIHLRSFVYLEAVPLKSEKQFLAALKDGEVELRRRAVVKLGEIRSQAAIAPMIDLLADVNPQMQQAAVDALVRIGLPAMEAVNAAVAEKRVRPGQVESLLMLFAQEEVERALDKLITPTGGSGTFEGQFKGLAAIGREKLIPVLLKIAGDPSYRSRIQPMKGDPSFYQLHLKSLALMALGEFGDATVAAQLKEIMASRKLTFGDNDTEALVVVLYRLGDKGPYEDQVKRAQKEAEDALRADDKGAAGRMLFTLGQMQNRVGDRAGAEKSYERALPWLEETGNGLASPTPCEVLYNLACLASLRGDKAKAVDQLIRAVDAGFKDRVWIEADRDLEAIRNDLRYQALMADKAKFEEKKPEEKKPEEKKPEEKKSEEKSSEEKK